MADDPPPPRRRLRWGRGPMIAVIAVGAIAVILIATTHPWAPGTPTARFTLDALAITFAGSGAADVTANSVCLDRCPVTLSVGAKETVSFTITPSSTVTCDDSHYYTVSKVKETTASGAFSLVSVSADTASQPLPVTIPNPLTGSECVTTAQIWVTFQVVDEGAPTQIPSLQATVSET